MSRLLMWHVVIVRGKGDGWAGSGIENEWEGMVDL